MDQSVRSDTVSNQGNRMREKDTGRSTRKIESCDSREDTMIHKNLKRQVATIMLELDSPHPRIPPLEEISEGEAVWVCEIRIPIRGVTWITAHMPDPVIKPVPVRLLSNGGVSGPDQWININSGKECRFTLEWRQGTREDNRQRPVWPNYARKICMIKTGAEAENDSLGVVRCKLSKTWKLSTV